MTKQAPEEGNARATIVLHDTRTKRHVASTQHVASRCAAGFGFLWVDGHLVASPDLRAAGECRVQNELLRLRRDAARADHRGLLEVEHQVGPAIAIDVAV